MSDGVRVALFFAALFSASAINTAFLPLWFADRGLSATAIGQILGLASLLRVIAGPSWGSLADRMGQRRPVILTAGITACAAALLYLPLHGFLPLLLVAAAQGIAGSALNPLIDSLALALARARRMEYGPVRSFGSIAYMAASSGAGWLLSVTGTFLVPWLLAVSYSAASVVTPFLPEAVSPPVSRGFAGLRLLANRPFRLTVIASALIQGSHAAYYGFAPLYWRSQGMSDAVIGLLMAEAIIAEIALFAWGRGLIARLGPAGLTACAAAASAVRWSVTALAPPLTVLAAIQLLHAATFAMQHLSAMLLLSRAVPPERAATAQALHSALGMGAPGGLLMLLAGYLYAHFGGLAFLAMAATGGSALLLVRPIMRLR
jgi:MFS transporter, PPP family, 3-phenylpropionic acid transporter